MYSAQKQTYKTAGEEVGSIDLTYKTFRFFGSEKQITAPISVNEDVQYYKNDFNDKNATISYNGEVKDAWKLSGNKEVTLTYSTPGYTQDVNGTIKVSAMELIKANLPLYLLSLLILVIVLVLFVLVIRIINTSKRKRRRRY